MKNENSDEIGDELKGKLEEEMKRGNVRRNSRMDPRSSLLRRNSRDVIPEQRNKSPTKSGVEIDTLDPKLEEA